MYGYIVLKWLEGLIPPAAFLLILWILLEPRCSRGTARMVCAGFLAAELAVQWAVYAGGGPEAVFTLLPLTLCLPAIVGAQLLSRHRFVPTAVGWLLALLGQQLLAAARKLLMLLGERLGSPAWAWAMGGVLLLMAAGLTVLIYRVFRNPFRSCAGELDGSWWPLLLLLLMLLALHSYFLSDAVNVTVMILLLLTEAASFGTLAQMMSALPERLQARESRLQMEALRQDCEVLQRKLELGRGFRHDMRHHVLALSALLRQGDCQEALRYTEEWQGQLAQTETRSWCRSAPVNAVLSAYLTQAEAAGCTLETEVSLPGEFPVEELDLCVVLANALENAIHACQAMPEGAPREISLELALTDHRRLTLHMRNSCAGAVEFDKDGFPVTKHREEGHGQGLRSIAAVAEKYHGLFRCGCAGGVFDLQVVLLDGAPELRRVRRAPAVLAGVFLCLFLLNCMPAVAQALEGIPALGRMVRVVDLRSYAWLWGSTGMSVREPMLEGGGAADAVNDEWDAFIARAREAFLDCAARKYQGYAAEDISYEVLRDDEDLLILRFDATLNAGGSMDFHRHVVLNRRTEQVLTLADLFQSGANYVFPISREIQAQMAERVRDGEGDYFIPGGIWSEEECFQSIDPEDQDFYIDDDGQLVIAFDEYEVAPGSMGAPAFTIPTGVLGGILAQPSVLR